LRYREMFINDEIEIVVPDLILYEIGNALRYNPSFNDEDVRLAVRSLIDLGINIISLPQRFWIWQLIWPLSTIQPCMIPCI